MEDVPPTDVRLGRVALPGQRALQDHLGTLHSCVVRDISDSALNNQCNQLAREHLVNLACRCAPCTPTLVPVDSPIHGVPSGTLVEHIVPVLQGVFSRLRPVLELRCLAADHRLALLLLLQLGWQSLELARLQAREGEILVFRCRLAVDCVAGLALIMGSSWKLYSRRLRSLSELDSRRHTTVYSLARLWHGELTSLRARLLKDAPPSSDASDGVTFDAFKCLFLAEGQGAHFSEHSVRQLFRHSTRDRNAICSPHGLTRRPAHYLKGRSDAPRRPIHTVAIIARVRSHIWEFHGGVVVLGVLRVGQAAAGHRGASHFVTRKQLLLVAVRAEALVSFVSGLANSMLTTLIGFGALWQLPTVELSVVQLLEIKALLAVALILAHHVLDNSVAATRVPHTVVDVEAFRGWGILTVGEALDLELLGTLRRHQLVGRAGKSR
mmetsp:Transcript_57714/g.126502  ORF Transcript_57714/g.126502 Transcript_57714/m.126502 type:complete len:438 (+) Transcript_57714:566-1879(+)